MRESDLKIHPVSENFTFQFLFMKLNARYVILEDISEFYSCLLVSLAFSITLDCGILSLVRSKTFFSLKLPLITLMCNYN